jgi:hypothetical protein
VESKRRGWDKGPTGGRGSVPPSLAEKVVSISQDDSDSDSNGYGSDDLGSDNSEGSGSDDVEDKTEKPSGPWFDL